MNGRTISEPKAYVAVARRSIEAARMTAGRVQEKAGFLAYHAFESCGGAFCHSRGVVYPRSHAKKVDVFFQTARRERFARQVTQLAIEYRSLRNSLLYPKPLRDGTVRVPEDVITKAQAIRLIGRTETLVEKVDTVV